MCFFIDQKFSVRWVNSFVSVLRTYVWSKLLEQILILCRQIKNWSNSVFFELCTSVHCTDDHTHARTDKRHTSFNKPFLNLKQETEHRVFSAHHIIFSVRISRKIMYICSKFEQNMIYMWVYGYERENTLVIEIFSWVGSVDISWSQFREYSTIRIIENRWTNEWGGGENSNAFTLCGPHCCQNAVRSWWEISDKSP